MAQIHPVCNKCGHTLTVNVMTIDELRVETARLREQIEKLKKKLELIDHGNKSLFEQIFGKGNY